MKILITGAAGFIGTHLVNRLHDQHEIFALSRSRPSNGMSSKARWIVHDLADPLDYSGLPAQVDVIVHLAQSRFYHDFPEQAGDIFAINVNSTYRLLEYARRVNALRFIFSSTGGVYGNSDKKFVETDPVKPLNFYLSSKYMAELMIANYQQFFDTTVFRLFFVYGAGQAETMLIPRLVNSVISDRPVILQRHDGIQINPVHVSDVVNAFERTLSLEGHHLMNLGGPQVLSLREIGKLIGAELDREPLFEVRDDLEPGHLIGDVTKVRGLLGEPQVSFQDGVVEVCHEALATKKN
jgi:UDP-glucose 4-epimerase